MGFELVYCWKCTKRLTEKDFANGKAFRVGIQTSCIGCADELLAPLSPQQRDAILNPPTKDAPQRHDSPRPAKPVSPRDVPAVGHRPSAPARKGIPPPLLIGGIVVLILVVLLALVSSKKDPPPDMPPTPPKVAPPPVDPPAPPKPATDPATSTPAKPAGPVYDLSREPAAQAALRKARDYQKAKPDDLETIAQLFEQAVWECEKTPYVDDAMRGRADALAKFQQSLAPILAALNAEVAPAMEREQYQKALDLLEDARKKSATGEWGRILERKKKEVLDTVEGNFIRLKTKARAARDRNDADELKGHKDNVKSWGIPKYVEELDRFLSGPS
jgi:hypothetical protein